MDLETGAVVAVTLGGGRFKFLAIPVSKRSVACGESGLRGARRVLPDFAYVCGNSVQEQEAVFIRSCFSWNCRQSFEEIAPERAVFFYSQNPGMEVVDDVETSVSSWDRLHHPRDCLGRC